MRSLQFDGLLTENGWICPAMVELDNEGAILSVSKGTPNNAHQPVEKVAGYALPGFQNAHSHAFQYAMAGLAERHPPGQLSDNFWSWREKMYRIALTMEPDQLEAAATMLYSEMLRHGYTHVAEFHYLHHDKSGKTYTNPAETGERLVAAAANAGIKITLVPMFYQKGGFGKDPEDHQRRFICPNLEDYWQLLEASQSAVAKSRGASLGFGAHSLRAVYDEELQVLYNEGPSDLPFHIHIAEQLKEVDDCQQFLNQRPVEYLYDQLAIDQRCHLVHATHLNERELEMISTSGAHVVLCPTTEGNLGDGLFRFREFKDLGGRWSIGTDSHVSLSPLEELRLLDYGQRLITHQRDTFVDDTGDSGQYAYNQALISGRQAMGNHSPAYFSSGQPFDAVVFNSHTPLLGTSSEESLLSTIIYSTETSAIIGTMVDGQWTKVQPQVLSNFRTALAQMAIR